MDIYASDEEKGEEIKRWWRENGLSVVAGIVLGIAGLFGGRYWLAQQEQQVTNASTLYQQTVIYLSQNQTEQASAIVDDLISAYAATPYAAFAALEMAKQNATSGQTDKAKTYLQWVIEQAELPGQKDIARLRLAKLLLDESDYAAAMTMVSARQTEAFQSLFDEIKGDIHLAQGQTEQANSAYQAAMADMDINEPRRVVLKLKLDDVTGS